MEPLTKILPQQPYQNNGTLLVEDSRTSVKVSKVDISDGKELEGAHIQIIDQDGNVVDEWDSTKEAHVTEKLKTGKIYTLRETVAPDGYLPYKRHYFCSERRRNSRCRKKQQLFPRMVFYLYRINWQPQHLLQ